MGENVESDVHLVEVHMTDLEVGGKPAVQLWAAAMPRYQAEDAVRRAIKAINPAWTAALSKQCPSADLIQKIALRPGEVREITS